jgi:hypothetical protein
MRQRARTSAPPEDDNNNNNNDDDDDAAEPAELRLELLHHERAVAVTVASATHAVDFVDEDDEAHLGKLRDDPRQLEQGYDLRDTFIAATWPPRGTGDDARQQM